MEQIAQTGRKRPVENGAYLFMEGDPAEWLLVVLQGRVRLSQVTADGQQVILQIASPGESIGVIAVLSAVEYPVTAQAVEESLVMAWDHQTMRSLMEQMPGLALNALQIMAGRVRQFQDRVRELSTEKVERRIARALLRLASQTGRKVAEGVLIDFSLSRQDLAEMTGTTLFTVSRTLSQWESQGLVKSRREQVIICSPHGLVSIAEDLPKRNSPASYLKE